MALGPIPLHRPDPCRRGAAATVVKMRPGSSRVVGLSEVTTTGSGQRAAMAPFLGPLPRSRVTTAVRTHRSVARLQKGLQAAKAFFQAIWRCWASRSGKASVASEFQASRNPLPCAGHAGE